MGCRREGVVDYSTSGNQRNYLLMHDTIPLRVVFFTSLSSSVQSLSKSLANLFSIFYLTLIIDNYEQIFNSFDRHSDP